MGRPPKNTTGIPKPMISAHEAEGIEQDLEKLKEMAGAGELVESTSYSPAAQIDDICVDKESIRRKIATLSKQLDYHKNQRVTDPVQRRKLEARREYLQEKFMPILETFKDIGVIRRDDPNWRQAWQKAVDRPKYEHYITEWKRIGIMLEPEDPRINSLDRIRKDS